MAGQVATDLERELQAGVPFDGVVPAPTGPSLASTMYSTPVPAVSVAAVVDGEVAWAGAWGVTSTADPQPVSPSTVFQAGSISKTVAAFCALQLVDRGCFGLDEAVNEIVGEPLVRTADDKWQPRVTVRHLLSHTAGVNVGGYSGYASRSYPDAREIIEGSSRTNTPPVRVIAVPGTRFAYSGGGYVVLQEVIAAATGVGFEQVAAELLAAAGMKRSTYVQDVPDGDRAAGHRVDGTPVGGGFRRYPEMAAAGLWTTPTDLAHFLTVLMQARSSRSGALLPPELAAEMFTPHSDQSYGLGIELSRHGRRDWFGHAGDTQGFEADLLGTSHGLGLAVMANADMSRNVINAVRSAVARHDSWPAVPGVIAPAGGSTPVPPLGRYVAADGRTISVVAGAGGADLIVEGQPALPLRWDGRRGWTSAEVNVTLMPEGPSRVVLLQTLQHGPVPEMVADRVPGV